MYCFFICLYDNSETKKIIQLASFWLPKQYLAFLFGKNTFFFLVPCQKKVYPQHKMFTYNRHKALTYNSQKALTYNSQKALR